MSSEEQISIAVTAKESYALNMIKGLPEDASYMVILTKKDEQKNESLVGPWKTFYSLLTALYEEVEFELSPRSRLSHIRSVIGKIEEIYPEEESFH